MTLPEILARADQAGVVLRPDGSQLRYRCPREALTPELRDLLTSNKTAILAHLSALEEALSLALALLEEAQALRPGLQVFGIVADLARRYHAAGNLELVEHAVTTARRMLTDLQRRGSSRGT